MFNKKIDKGKHKGLYVTELNGMHGLINQDNQTVMSFQKKQTLNRFTNL